jgi:hypothetical protein
MSMQLIFEANVFRQIYHTEFAYKYVYMIYIYILSIRDVFLKLFSKKIEMLFKIEFEIAFKLFKSIDERLIETK